ncbi:MAG: IS91 family transposase [Chthoniobacterales bacterium]
MDSLAALSQPNEFKKLLSSAGAKSWIVYGKKPFAGPAAVLAYRSRYTHRVAIGNGRLLRLDKTAGTLTFNYKDYADLSRRKRMELSLTEFLRRFCLHILPERFVKIRHYGLLANRNRAEKIALARAQLGSAPQNALSLPTPGQSPSAAPTPLICPHCGSANLILVARRHAIRAPPPPTDSS